ncbi:Gfo/Idh/MocA family oxidoreductase [bacterium]|nr:Gfo/Idh/MocA family oxidoreductase [bacterium]
MDKIRVAFIGCGGMSSQLQKCIPLIPEFEFVATCDLIEEKAKGNARKFGALSYYTNYDEMLNAEELDAVAVVGRPEDKLHRDIGIECLQRGYHIYTEKPPATTVEGAKMIVDAMKKSGKTGMVGTMWRHAPAHRMAKQFMDEESFGEPCQYQTRYLAPTPRIQSTDSPFAWPFMFASLSSLLRKPLRPGDSPNRLHALFHGTRQSGFCFRHNRCGYGYAFALS